MRVWLAVSLALLAGCPDEGLLAENLPSSRVDSGFFRVDAGFDAGPRPDARPIVEPDAALPDAAPEPACECPSIPTACPALTPNVPAFSPGGALTRQIFDLIACADHELHLAMYETDWDCAVTALIDKLAQDADVQLKLVIDDALCPLDPGGTRLCALARLHGHPRVTIVDDMRSRYMHHKFAIADGRVAWVGSSNLTRLSLCSELNDGILIDAPEIIAAYEAEFRRLFVDRVFGPRFPEPPARDARYAVYFGPETPLTTPSTWFRELVTAVDTASSSVFVMTSAWTRTEVSDALIRAARRGVEVRAIVPFTYRDEAPAQALIAAGLGVRVARVHSKLLIVDERRVVTGSPNWSENSWANNEASVWIEDALVAAAYRARFEDAYMEARAP